MQDSQNRQLERELQPVAGRVGFAAVVPNPKLKRLDPVREVLRIFVRSLQTAEQRKR